MSFRVSSIENATTAMGVAFLKRYVPVAKVHWNGCHFDDAVPAQYLLNLAAVTAITRQPAVVQKALVNQRRTLRLAPMASPDWCERSAVGVGGGAGRNRHHHLSQSNTEKMAHTLPSDPSKAYRPRKSGGASNYRDVAWGRLTSHYLSFFTSALLTDIRLTTKRKRQPMKLIRMPEVIARVGLQKTAIYDRIEQETFPKPIKLGSASTWIDHEITSWIEQQIELSRPGSTSTTSAS